MSDEWIDLASREDLYDYMAELDELAEQDGPIQEPTLSHETAA